MPLCHSCGWGASSAELAPRVTSITSMVARWSNVLRLEAMTEFAIDISLIQVGGVRDPVCVALAMPCPRGPSMNVSFLGPLFIGIGILALLAGLHRYGMVLRTYLESRQASF